MKSKVYEELVSFLLSLQNLDIQLVDILKRQLTKAEDYLPNHYPAILLKLGEITWDELTEEGLQFGEVNLAVWVIQKNQETASHAYKSVTPGKFDFLDLPERIFENLEGFVIPGILRRLERTASRDDVFTKSTIRQATNYRAFLIDDSVKRLRESKQLRLTDVEPSIEAN